MAADALALTVEQNLSCDGGGPYDGKPDERVGDELPAGRPIASTLTRNDSIVLPLSDVFPSGKLDIQKKISSLRFSDFHTGETKVNASRILGLSLCHTVAYSKFCNTIGARYVNQSRVAKPSVYMKVAFGCRFHRIDLSNTMRHGVASE